MEWQVKQPINYLEFYLLFALCAMLAAKFLVLFSFFALCFGSEFLEVYVIPHSHCDVGWKKTMDEYYEQEVHWILHNATDALTRSSYPGVVRKFNWDVQAFFQKWYKTLSTSKKDEVKQLVEDGLLDFVGFGWVQSDEAVADLFARVLQMTEGHNYIAQEFPGFIDTPRVAWQIDPFGASSITPVLFSLAGYDGLVHERIPRALQGEWKAQHKLQYKWTGNPPDLTSSLWSHNLGDPTNDYCTPGDPPPPGGGPYGFDWEADDDGDPNKDPIITPENIQARAEVLVQIMHTRSKWIKEGVPLLFPFGCDFRFQKAEAQYSNMDQLIYYINSNSSTYNIHLQYGLVSEWFTAVQNSENVASSWPTYQGDFLPYNNKQNDFWSGFYTSRPDIKRSSRYSESLLRFAEILHSAAQFYYSDSNAFPSDLALHLDSARQNISVAQHHDAITGTSPDTTMKDYLSRLRYSDGDSAAVITELTTNLLCKDSTCSETFSVYEAAPPTHQLPVISLPDNSRIPVAVSNPLAWAQSQFIQILINTQNATISFANGTVIPVQVQKQGNSFLYGFLLDLKPLEIAVVYIFSSETSQILYSSITPSGESVSIQNDFMEVLVNTSTCTITSVYDKMEEQSANVNQEFIEYWSPNSSAYSMKPDFFLALSPDDSIKSVTLAQGPIYSQIDVVFSSEIKWSSRLIHSSNPDLARRLDYSVLIGPLKNNTEISMRFNTNWKTEGIWFSDNGIVLDEHNRVHLPYMDAKGIGSNFHSLKNTAVLRDTVSNNEFVVLTAQSAGVSSLEDGQLEVMLHRRCGSWIDHTQVHLFYHLVFGTQTNVEYYRPTFTQQLQFPVVVQIGSSSDVSDDFSLIDSFFLLTESFPRDVHLFSSVAGSSLAMGKPTIGNCSGVTNTLGFRIQNLAANASSFDLSLMGVPCSPCSYEERGLTFLPLKEKKTQESATQANSSISLDPFALRTFVAAFPLTC